MTVQLTKKDNIVFYSVLSLLIFVYLWHYLYIYLHNYIKIFPYSDADFYWNWARDVVKGQIDAPFVGLPGYPFLLSLFYRLYPSVKLVVLLQHLIGVAVGLMLYRIVKRLSNSYWAGFSVLLYILYTPFLMYASILTPELFALFLLALWFHEFVKDRFSLKDAILSGLLGGILVITRLSFFLWSLSMAFFIPIRFLTGSKRVSFTLIYLIGLFIPILMVMRVNYLHSGTWQLTAHSGINFYIGNSKISSGLFYTGGIFRPTQSGMIEDARIIASKINGKALSTAQASKFWFEKAMDFIVTHPIRFLLLLGKKFLLLFNATEYHDANWRAMRIPILPFLSFAFIFPWSFIALWTTRRDPRVGILRLCFVLTSLATLLVFINTRYKLMVVFPGIILAVLGIRDLLRLWRERYWGEAICLSFLVVGFTVLGNVCWIPVVKDVLAVKFNRAMEFLDSGHMKEARRILEELVTDNPKDYLSWFALGNTYYYSHQLSKAERCYINALIINPWFADALFNLGIIYLDRRDFLQAENYFSQLYEVSPSKADVLYNLIRAKVGLGKCKEAEKLKEELLELLPASKEQLENLLKDCK